MSFASDIKKFALGAGVHTDEAVRAFQYRDYTAGYTINAGW